MKIAFIIHSLGIGGMERVMAHLINEISKDTSIEIHVVLIGNKREVLYKLPENVKVYKPLWEFDNAKRNYHTFKTIFFIRKTIKSIKPQTVLSFGEIWNNLVLLSAIGINVPIYISDRSIPGKNLGTLQNLLRNKLYPRANGFIAQTEKAAEYAKKLDWNKNIKIIGNPVPKFQMQTLASRKNIVLTVSRLIPTKNIDRLIDLFAQITLDVHWDLNIVGGNAKKMNLLEEYREEVEKRELGDRIHLLGEQKGVNKYYAEASIFAFTSTSEGFPNALAEAMAAGCACIAYDCMAGPSDMIDNGINGFLIPEGNESLFIEKLTMLMLDEKLCHEFGKAAIEKMKTFEISVIANTFYNFISNDKSQNRLKLDVKKQ